MCLGAQTTGTHARHTCPPPPSTHTHARTRSRVRTHTHARTRAHAEHMRGQASWGCAPSALPETSRTTAQSPHCLGSSLARARNAPPHPHRPDACKRGRSRHAEQSCVAECALSAMCTTVCTPCVRCGERARRQTRRCLRRRTRRRCMTLWYSRRAQ